MKTDEEDGPEERRLSHEHRCRSAELGEHTNDETVPETNLDEDSELPRMLTILDDPEEVMKGRQKELNPLKEMGVMTAVKRTTAAGKRVIQTGWVDREKDGCVKSQLVLKDKSQSRTDADRDVCTNPIDTVPENNAGHELTRSKRSP